jgi:hypothetical protein
MLHVSYNCFIVGCFGEIGADPSTSGASVRRNRRHLFAVSTDRRSESPPSVHYTLTQFGVAGALMLTSKRIPNIASEHLFLPPAHSADWALSCLSGEQGHNKEHLKDTGIIHKILANDVQHAIPRPIVWVNWKGFGRKRAWPDSDTIMVLLRTTKISIIS